MGIKNIFGQRYLGKHWGMIAVSASQLSIFVGIINILLNSVDSYSKVHEWLQQFGYNIEYWQFLGVIILVLTLTLFGLFKYALPSFYSFWNDQFYKHDNPIKADIEILREENKKEYQKIIDFIKIENEKIIKKIGEKDG